MFPELVLSVFDVHLEVREYVRVIILQIELDLLGGKLQKIPLDVRGVYSSLHLPDNVNMVWHDDKSVNEDTVVRCQKT